ncbi:GNAT family N-acetyltransferase [Candidatus Eisenbacteria bacterium]|uniref:GNAT family N-acetyltransferase n=1 Tax=Eiseniibacteriota bacterium TaxID=2212470 RepID=A0ABV6YM47_UNCEI
MHDKRELETFLRRDAHLHIYEIGDLDDFFWPHTVWFGLIDEVELDGVVLLYLGTDPPSLLALTGDSIAKMRDFLVSIKHLLPTRFYAHLSSGLAEIFAESHKAEAHGLHYKLALTKPAQLESVGTSDVVSLSSNELPELGVLYEAAYPETWFNPRMMETGHYFGLRRDGLLVGVAGIHVFSRRYQVAALGNVATHPDYRGQGVARATCAHLCRVLLSDVDHIGANVKADNVSALACYERLGFERIASYEEWDMRLKV